MYLGRVVYVEELCYNMEFCVYDEVVFYIKE